MDEFRAAVATILAGKAPHPTLIPALESNGPNNGNPRPTLRRGSKGPHVRRLLRLLQLTEHEDFDASTESKVREFQRRKHLVPDGIVGPKTWRALG